MSDIDEPARSAYALGADPLGYAESVVVETILTNAMVAAARMYDPAAFPGHGEPVGPVGLARRVLGELLQAGWTMPETRERNDP